MAAETGFLIDGTVYPMPTRETFDTDEWQLMWDYARLTLEDFLFVDDEEEPEDVQAERAEKFRNPAVWKSLMHIAYQRGNPTLSAAKVKALVGKVNMLEALSGLFADEEGDAEVPPASTSEPENSSQTGSLDNSNSARLRNASSTALSTNGSSEPESDLATTTALRSGIPSISPQTSSVA